MFKNSFSKVGFTYHKIHQFHVDNPVSLSKYRVGYPSQYIYLFKETPYYLFIFECTGSLLLLEAFSSCPECCTASLVAEHGTQ